MHDCAPVVVHVRDVELFELQQKIYEVKPAASRRVVQQALPRVVWSGHGGRIGLGQQVACELHVASLHRKMQHRFPMLVEHAERGVGRRGGRQAVADVVWGGPAGPASPVHYRHAAAVLGEDVDIGFAVQKDLAGGFVEETV